MLGQDRANIAVKVDLVGGGWLLTNNAIYSEQRNDRECKKT